MTLRCPKCSASFHDFDGCTALKCETCNTHFCAWCLEIASNSQECHRHVATCPKKPEDTNVFYDNSPGRIKWKLVTRRRICEQIALKLEEKTASLCVKIIFAVLPILRGENMLEILKEVGAEMVEIVDAAIALSENSNVETSD